jgi:hypothetical protein
LFKYFCLNIVNSKLFGVGVFFLFAEFILIIL